MSEKDRKENPKDHWAQISKEAAIEQAEKEFKVTEGELLAAYDDSEEAPPQATTETGKTLKEEWEHLKRIAMVQFPEGTRILGLTPKNRLVAIALCLGWNVPKIADASGVAIPTIYTWRRRPDIKLFMDEFNLRQGVGNTDILKAKMSEMEYLATNCITAILKDRDNSEGMKRLKLDASKWVFNLTRDKTEDASGGLRKLLETLGKIATTGEVQISKEEEDVLFEKKVN